MKLRSALIPLVALSGLVIPPATASADELLCPDEPPRCRWLRHEVRVFFNPGLLPASEVHLFRRAMRLAISVWNEEASTNLRLYYAGDTTDLEIPGSIVVRHMGDDFFDGCENANVGARATLPGIGGFCDVDAHHITVNMAFACDGAVMPMLWAHYLPNPGDPANPYTDMMVHEFGHAVLGLIDTTDTDTVMDNAGLGATKHAHLHPRDLECAISREGYPDSEPVTYLTLDAGASWSPALEVDPGDTALMTASTIGPGLAQRIFDLPALVAMTEPTEQVPILGMGEHGGWGDFVFPAVPDAAHSWVSVARARFNEGPVMAVWPTDCNTPGNCAIAWAWAPTYPTPAEDWVTGTVPNLRTFARPAVGYHAGTDRFVLVAPEAATGWLQSAWSFATAPGWVYARKCGSLQCVAPVRYVGGLVFDPDPASDLGLLTAAVDWEYDEPGKILQYGVEYDAVDDAFAIEPAQELAGVSEFEWTSRHFGMSLDEESSTIMVAWANADAPEGCHAGRSSEQVMVAIKDVSEIDSALPFQEPIATGLCAYSSVDVAAGQGSFTVGTVLRGWALGDPED